MIKIDAITEKGSKLIKDILSKIPTTEFVNFILNKVDSIKTFCRNDAGALYEKNQILMNCK